jgi:hypothetical protein
MLARRDTGGAGAVQTVEQFGSHCGRRIIRAQISPGHRLTISIQKKNGSELTDIDPPSSKQ